jgi:hypothetical protein
MVYPNDMDMVDEIQDSQNIVHFRQYSSGWFLSALGMFIFLMLVICNPSMAQLTTETTKRFVNMSSQSIATINPLKVVCSSIINESGKLGIKYEIKNVTDETVYIFDSQRMPYILLQEEGSLLILYGINSPDPDIDYPLIEIPITKPIHPGESVKYEVSLKPLYLRDHYQKQTTATELQGLVKVDLQIGWGTTPILPSDRHNISINQLLEWQHISKAQTMEIDFSE